MCKLKCEWKHYLQEIKEYDDKILVFGDDLKAFERDPKSRNAPGQLILVKADLAQGLHILNDYELPFKIFVDHLPPTADLVRQYAAIGLRCKKEADATFFVWQNKRDQDEIERLSKDINRVEIKDGVRMINILRGRERLKVIPDPAFDRLFIQSSWRLSI